LDEKIGTLECLLSKCDYQIAGLNTEARKSSNELREKGKEIQALKKEKTKIEVELLTKKKS